MSGPTGAGRPEDRRPALVVTGVPPTLGDVVGHGPFLSNPSGFSPRLYHFVAALAGRRPVDVAGVLMDRRDVDVPFFDADLDVRHYHPLLVGYPASSRPGLRGRVANWRQFLVGTLPGSCHPRRLTALEALLARGDHDLVVFYLPQLAHLARHVPRGLPVVCAMEEGWERIEALGVGQRDIGSARKAWINTTERWRADRLYRRVARRAAAVVAISEEERDWFARSVPAERIAVLRHGIDPEYFRPGAADGGEEDLDVAVFGLLFHPRNGEPAARAWRIASATEDGGRWQWGFVGPVDDAFRSAVASPRTLVTGVVPDVRPYYRRAKVVVVPADRGTGVKTTLLQAWAMGKPVVASPFALTGVPARPGENVLVGGTPEAMAAETSRLLNSPELRRRIGAAGRATVEAHCDVRALAEHFADLCEEAAGRRPA